VQELTENNKQDRLRLSRQMLRTIPHRDLAKLWFSDECYFPISGYVNRQNTRLRARSRAAAGVRRLKEKQKFPKALMIWGAVSKIGKTRLDILPVGQRVNATTYDEMLRFHIVPELRRLSGARRYIFQQDGAPAHRAAVCQTTCRQLMPRFIPHDKWPANSCDLNPMDYGVWGILRDKVLCQRYRSIDELKLAIQVGWDEISQKPLTESSTIGAGAWQP